MSCFDVFRLSYSRCSNHIRAIQNQIETIRKEHLFLKDFYSKEILNWKTSFRTAENSIQKGIHLLQPSPLLEIVLFSSEIQINAEKYSQQITNDQTEIKQYQHQLK